jgi:hypothetical protein
MLRERTLDGKLAAGLTREALRNEKKKVPASKADVTALFQPSVLKLRSAGKLTRPTCEALMRRCRKFIGEGNFTYAHRYLPGASLRSGSSNFDAALMMLTLGPGELSISSRPERALDLYATMYRITNHRLGFRHVASRLVVRPHAIRRFLERSDLFYRDLMSSLRPGLLLFPSLYDPDTQQSPFVLPTTTGLFLGLFTVGGAGPDADAVETVEFTAKGRETRRVAVPSVVNGHGSIAVVNTFLDENALSDDQVLLRDELLALSTRYAVALEGILTAGMLIFEPEREAFDLTIHTDAHKWSEALQAISEVRCGELWDRAVRNPRYSALFK